MNRRAVLASGAALLAGGRVGAQDGAPREPLAGAWVRAIPGVTALAVGPDGSRVLAATQAGLLRCYGADGLVLWETDEPRVERLALARRGAVAVAWSPLDALAPRLRLFGAGGRRLGAVEAAGPLEHAALAADGAAAALVGGGRLTLAALGPAGPVSRSVPLPGRAAQVQMGPGGGAYVVLRDPDAVELYGPDGRRAWRRAEPGCSAYSVSASEDGRTVAVACERPGGDVEVLLVTGQNQARLLDRRPGRRPRVKAAAGGGAVMLTYEHRLEHQGEVRWARRLAYLGPGAGSGWPKGGSFSAPLFVAIERSGEWIVAVDTQDRGRLPRFRLYGRGGERRWFYASSAPVLLAAACGEGRTIAVYRTDGFLELLRVNLEPGNAPAPAVPAAPAA